MTRNLLILFAGAGLLALVLLAAAWTINGRGFVSDLQHTHGWTLDMDDGGDGPRASRSFAYDAARPLTLDLPVDMRFRRGPGATITVDGNAQTVAALRWQDGRLSIAPGRHVAHTLHVTVIAPRLPQIVLNGAGDIALPGLDQPALALTVNGSGDVSADGRVGRVDIVDGGVGDIDLGKLATTDATVRATGVGAVTIAATGNVAVDLSGVGSVTLTRRPASLVSHVSGVGTIDRDY